MPRDIMTISLPQEMMQEVDEVREREHRTRSELVREALRTYFAVGRTFPVYTATTSELKALEKARAQMSKGQYYTLDELRDWLLGGKNQKARAKKRETRPSLRT